MRKTIELPRGTFEKAAREGWSKQGYIRRETEIEALLRRSYLATGCTTTVMDMRQRWEVRGPWNRFGPMFAAKIVGRVQKMRASHWWRHGLRF